MPSNIHRVSYVNLSKKTVETIVLLEFHRVELHFRSEKNSKSRKLFDERK